jgi:2'-5' RNA ligase
MARLFVAAVPPAPVLDALAALRRPDEPGVRYTVRDQWHVTLRFLGSCEPDAAQDALHTLDAPAGEAVLGPRVARLGRSVIAVPVHGLDDLAAAVVGATADVGEPPDPRPFTGHLTMARLKGRAACGIAGEAVDLRFAVSEIHLVSSELGADRARYRSLARFPLRTGA